MADVTVPVAGFNNNLVVVELIYDDTSLVFKRIQATNNSEYPCALAIRKANALVREHLVSAHSISGRNLPSTVVFVERIDEGETEPSLSLDDIEIHCRWPA